jgi:hypothetical protein
MSPFALRLGTLNATTLGIESAFRQETERVGDLVQIVADRGAGGSSWSLIRCCA